jgi:hypothetical protein
MSNLSALIGQLVFANLPEAEAAHRPGPKYRPTLVVDIRGGEGSYQVQLAYCTSQRTDRTGRGEMVIRPEETGGKLKTSTKLCLGKTFWVPVTKEYFYRNASSTGFEIIGALPKNRSRELLEKLEEVNGSR